MTFGELARRHKAAAVAIARTYAYTLDEVARSPVLGAWATSVFIESNRYVVSLSEDAPLREPLVLGNWRGAKGDVR